MDRVILRPVQVQHRIIIAAMVVLACVVPAAVVGIGSVAHAIAWMIAIGMIGIAPANPCGIFGASMSFG